MLFCLRMTDGAIARAAAEGEIRQLSVSRDRDRKIARQRGSTSPTGRAGSALFATRNTQRRIADSLLSSPGPTHCTLSRPRVTRVCRVGLPFPRSPSPFSTFSRVVVVVVVVVSSITAAQHTHRPLPATDADPDADSSTRTGSASTSTARGLRWETRRQRTRRRARRQRQQQQPPTGKGLRQERRCQMRLASSMPTTGRRLPMRPRRASTT